MKKIGVGIFAAVAISLMAAAADFSKTVIIKADDFRGTSPAWTNFLEVSRAVGVKVSIGVITESIHDKRDVGCWMQAQEKNGDVEFWDHGWDHKEWKTNGLTVSEFQGSGFAHQREHLAKSQAGLAAALGKDVIALGTGYNGFDADTAAVINETPELQLFFTHNVTSTKNLVTNRVAIVEIISESGGTAKPDATKFIAGFEKRPPGPVSLQFHPPYFDAPHLEEYKKIITYLKTHGYRLVLPAEFVAMTATNSLPANPAPLK